MRRKTAKHLKKEFYELDYLHKLDKKSLEWIKQFFYEYYQADFNYSVPIHPDSLKKDCRDRNNAAKRQLHSVGNNLLIEAANRALDIHNGTDAKQKSRFYSHLDYLKETKNDETEDNS